MKDRFHGSARPQPKRGDALFREVNRDFSSCTNRARTARARLRDARRRWIVDAGTTGPTTPMWGSRESWLADVDAWADTGAGREVLARLNVAPAMLLRVAEVLASHADHASGRHCAVTNAAAARAAHCSPRTVTTARAVLHEAGLAVEIRRGTGSSATPNFRRRASVWHLVSRPQPVHNTRICHLPPSLRDRRLPHVGKNSPSGRTRPPNRRISTKTRRRHCAPRLMATQKLAAAIVAGSIGLGGVHPGHICDALTRSGLKLEAWTPRQLLDALNADMRATGWSWPNRIERPGAFLAARLGRLPAAPACTAPTPASTAQPRIPDPVAPASAETRRAAMAYFRTHRAGAPTVSVPTATLSDISTEEE